MMNENKIMVQIPLDEYRELVTKAERIEAAYRFVVSSYASVNDVLTILGIEKEEVKKIEAI